VGDVEPVSVGEFAQLLTAFAVVGNCAISFRNSKKIEVVHDLTKKVQQETDGMKTELVNEVRAASFAKGVKSEVDKK
jgi:hypothetical protein